MEYKKVLSADLFLLPFLVFIIRRIADAQQFTKSHENPINQIYRFTKLKL